MSGDTTPISTILMATSMGEMMRNRGFCGMFQTAPSESVITHSHHLNQSFSQSYVKAILKKLTGIIWYQWFPGSDHINILLGHGSAYSAQVPTLPPKKWVKLGYNSLSLSGRISKTGSPRSWFLWYVKLGQKKTDIHWWTSKTEIHRHMECEIMWIN